MKSSYTRLATQQWQVMEKNLPSKTKGRYKLRDIADAILWVLRTGSQWRNLPECFPKWESVYYHFRKWGKDGILVRLNTVLNQMERKRQGKQQTPSMPSIDSQSVKSGPFTRLEKGIDGNKKTNGRKRHDSISFFKYENLLSFAFLFLCVGIILNVAKIMRQQLLRSGAEELTYEIRGIVKKARQVEALGYTMIWENIGDPIQKSNHVPDWMKEIIADLLKQDKTYGYADSKGVLETRKFLADLNNERGGTIITAEDILFFNGLGDAIAKLYQFLIPTARIIGPSPAYSTHSSAEAAHANAAPITYKLDPDNQWLPDMEDLYLKVRYNPSIVGILIINPDNPTGMVYPKEVLEAFVRIAEEFNLLLITDEIYQNITYNGITAVPLSEVIGDRPAISLKGISKEFPWPGARCGWMEFYNRESSKEFSKLCQTLENAKMIEVCSTILPQLAIPKIMKHPAYFKYREEANAQIGKRSDWMREILGNIPGIKFNPTQGAFYNTIVFDGDVLKEDRFLPIGDERLKTLLDSWLQEKNMPLDKRFVYNLLAAEQICVVPISSFCSDLRGFRVTLLEENEEVFKSTFRRLGKAIEMYLRPVVEV